MLKHKKSKKMGKEAVRWQVMTIAFLSVLIGVFCFTGTAEAVDLNITSINGTVTSNPGGIDCGGDCYENFGSGQDITLTATRDAGYRFEDWSGDTSGFSSTSSSPTTFQMGLSPRDVTANYVQQFTVTFDASESGGTLTGTASQLVDIGSDCSAVTANPPAGYRFENWTGPVFGTSTANPLTVTNVTSDMAITAHYVQQFTVIFDASESGGTLTGTASQLVDIGSDCSAVTANPPAGYRFENWTGPVFGTSTANPLTVTNVTSDMAITAHYVQQFTVIFDASESGGTLTGTASQLVDIGSDCSAVTANPPAGYRFENWTGPVFGTSTANPLTVTNVTSDMAITAHYVQQFTVIFDASESGGTLTGTASQLVDIGSDCSAVTANPPTGYHWLNWTGTGGFTTTTANPLTVMNVTSDMTITAHYEINTYTIIPTSGSYGSISPNTTQTVDHGDSQTFTFTPE